MKESGMMASGIVGSRSRNHVIRAFLSLSFSVSSVLASLLSLFSPCGSTKLAFCCGCIKNEQTNKTKPGKTLISLARVMYQSLSLGGNGARIMPVTCPPRKPGKWSFPPETQELNY